MDATKRHCRAVADLNSRNTVGTDQLYEGFRTADKATDIGSADDSDAPGNFQFIAVRGNGRICEEADIAVIGFGNYDAAPYFAKSLTSIGASSENTALEMIKAICGDREPFPENTERSYSIYERESLIFK